VAGFVFLKYIDEDPNTRKRSTQWFTFTHSYSTTIQQEACGQLKTRVQLGPLRMKAGELQIQLLPMSELEPNEDKYLGQKASPIFEDLFDLLDYVVDCFHCKLRNVALLFKLTKAVAHELGEAAVKNLGNKLIAIKLNRLEERDGASIIGRECDKLLTNRELLLQPLESWIHFNTFKQIWDVSTIIRELIHHTAVCR